MLIHITNIRDICKLWGVPVVEDKTRTDGNLNIPKHRVRHVSDGTTVAKRKTR